MQQLGVNRGTSSASPYHTIVRIGPRIALLSSEGVAVAFQKTPFENIEGALEYVTGLLDACRVAQTQVEVEIESGDSDRLCSGLSGATR